LKDALNQPGATESTDTIALTVNDLGGGSSTGNLVVQIIDSTVTANADSRNVNEDQVGIAGNVVTGANATADTMGVDTPVTVTGVQAGLVATEIASGVGGSGVAGTYGTLTIAADGTYTYVTNAAAQALNTGDSKADVFSYTIKDADGDFSTTTVTFTVQGSNDLPTISASQSSTVSEEGLTGGIVDSNPIGSDSTDSKISTGQFAVADLDGAVTVTLGLPAAGLTSGGNAVAWALSNANHTLTGTAAGQTVMTVVIDNTGFYTTTLLKPIDHPTGGGENLQSIPLTVTVSDGIASATSQLTVVVEDDAPTATNTVTSVTLPNVNTNIELTLDVSGSMAWGPVDGQNPTGGQLSRMQLMINSINGVAGTPGLLDGYDNLGDVRVRIVTFSTTAAAQGTSWLTVAQAKTIVAGLVPTNNTNYEAAINTAQTAFDSPGKIPGAQNVSYFLSDGTPNPATSRIDPPEEATWTNFLNTNEVTSFAFGIGAGATATDLNPIAYNGVGAGTNSNAVIVSDITQLPPILRDSVVAPTSGNVVNGGLGGSVGFGADGGHLETLTIDGTTYTYDPKASGGAGAVTKVGTGTGVFNTTDNTLAVNTTNGGKMVVNLDTGDYTYTAAPTITTAKVESISYTVRDKDGDPATAALTINVNPPPVVAGVPAHVVSISNPSALEGAALTYTVNLDIMTDTPTTFAYNLGLGTAAGIVSAADVGARSFSNGVTLNTTTGMLTVPAGVISFTVSMPTTTADGAETAETLPLTIGGVTGTGTIATGLPALAIGDITVNEGVGTATFTVTLSSASPSAVTVNYATANGTAVSGGGNDYTAKTGTLTFAAGQTSQTVTVAINNDSTVEPSETFFVNLSSPSANATISDSQGVATIVDNEPKISIGDVTVNEGAGTATFGVSLSQAATGNVTVSYSTSNGTATAGSDYTAIGATTLTFAAGETYKTITVNIANDTLGEGDETFNVNLTGPSANATIIDNLGVGTIVDNEPKISINDVSVNESAGAATFTVTLSAASATNVTVNYSTSNGTATAGSDYTAVTSTVLTFVPGETSKTFTVPITNNAIVEGNETFNVNLASASTNATILDGVGVATIVETVAAPVVAPLAAPLAAAASTSTTSTPTSAAAGFTDLNEIVKVNEDTTLKGSVLTSTTSASGTVTVTTFQVDGDLYVYKAGETVAMRGVGSLVISADGSYVFVPDANYNGPVPVVTYTMTDGSNNDTSTLTLSVTAVNDAPVAVQDTAVTRADTPVTLSGTTLLINDSDVDGDPLTLFSVQSANHGSVTMSGSDVLFTPTAGYTGAASFDYTISDGHGGTSTTTVTVDVTANAAPIASKDVVSGTANTPLTIASTTLLSNDTDPNGDPLTISAVLDATHGTVALVDGSVVFTPTKDYVGDASFSYTISDGHGGTASASVSLTIAAELLKAGTTPIP
jgi:T1SS-143 domain-containing protein